MKQFMFVVFAIIGNISHSVVYADTTYVSGHITSDTAWTKANSPYVVEENVYVDSLVILTIEPGVEVRLDSMKYIMIYGTLNALGIESDSILISALDTTKRWSRLWFKDASAGSLCYCRIEYAGKSAIFDSTASLLVIEYNIISNNSANFGGGILSYGSLMITGNIITGNYAEWGGGINSYYSSPTITGNTIADNSAYWGGGGIKSFLGSPIITGNTITGNSANSGGGSSYGGGICTRGFPTITDNTITSNSADYGGGICSSGSATIIGNTITGNSADYRGGSIYSNGSSTITSNTITGNSADYGGSIYSNDGTPTIKYNTITDTTESAIYIGTSSDSALIDSNNIYAIGYVVYNNFSFDIDARNNYWGTASNDTIDMKIWDFYDDSTRGIVYYEPFLSEPLDFGIEEHKPQVTSHKLQVEVYPNPFTQKTAIKLLSYSNGFCEQATRKASIQIYDLSGRLISSYLINQNPITIGKTLKAGIYFLKAQGCKPTKIVKLR